MMNFPQIFCFIGTSLLLTSCSQKNDAEGKQSDRIVFKAEAPVDSEEQNKYGFGSIWPGKEEFFKRKGKDIKTEVKGIEAKHVHRDVNQNPQKEAAWAAAMNVLQSFSIEYVDKEKGIIRTEEAYVPEFDSTETCTYKIIVIVTQDGAIKVEVQSAQDSKTIRKLLTNESKRPSLNNSL